jgi:hypothetical protein
MIGYDAHGELLTAKAGLKAEEGVGPLDDGFAEAAARRYWAREVIVRALP